MSGGVKPIWVVTVIGVIRIVVGGGGGRTRVPVLGLDDPDVHQVAQRGELRVHHLVFSDVQRRLGD
jgi:hypothetical protein